MYERTKAGNQICFGKIKALQPKVVKRDKGEVGTPLFSQEEEDPNQLDIFGSEKNENKKGETDNE